jgi:hypothetical protein
MDCDRQWLTTVPVDYPTDRTERTQRYLQEGFTSLWAQSYPESVRTALEIDRALFAVGVDGAVGEVGVLQGSFFIALHNLIPECATSLAIDCFDLPDYAPLDLTGTGYARATKTDFLAKLSEHAHRPDAVRLIECDSGTLGPVDYAAIRKDVGPLKMFCVDGLHTYDHTLHDLRMGAALLAEGGVLILDDYPGWDGNAVPGAAHDFIDESEFQPFAVGCNKLYLVRGGPLPGITTVGHMWLHGCQVPRVGWLRL